MVALEALAAGLPVIASRNTPWREIEESGAGAWVENAPEAFVAAILRVLEADRVRMRKAAQLLARQYDVSAIADRLMEIYAKLKSNVT